MSEDAKTDNRKFIEGVSKVFLCILLYQLIVGNSNPWSKAVKQTAMQTWDGIKSPFTGRVEYRIKDILDRDTIGCDAFAELCEISKYIDNINVESANGTTLLIGAVRAENHFVLFHHNNAFHCKDGMKTQFIERLISEGVNLNARDKMGRTALIWNTINRDLTGGYFKIEKLLINHEAAIGYRDIFGKTALDYAQQAKDTELLNLLTNAHSIGR